MNVGGGIAVRGSAALMWRAEASLDARLPAPLRMMYRDAITYLPGRYTVQGDRASMAVSLNRGFPFLDHRVAAVAARIRSK